MKVKVGQEVTVDMGEDMPEPEAQAVVAQINEDTVRVLVKTGYFAGCYISIYEHDIKEESRYGRKI